MERILLLNIKAPFRIAFCVVIVLAIFPGSYGQYDTHGDMNGMIAFEVMPDSIGLAGSLNLSLSDIENQYLLLDLHVVNEYIFGSGILMLNNISRKVTAAGRCHGDFYELYIVAYDGCEMIRVQLEEIEGIISGEYKLYYEEGDVHIGKVSGSKMIELIPTEWPPFGVQPYEIIENNNSKREKMESENISANVSIGLNSSKYNIFSEMYA